LRSTRCRRVRAGGAGEAGVGCGSARCRRVLAGAAGDAGAVLRSTLGRGIRAGDAGTAPGRTAACSAACTSARAPCCAGSVPGSRTPAHTCAQRLICCGCVGWSRGGESCRWSIRQPRPHGAIRTSTTTRAGRRHRVAHALGAVTALTGSTASLQTKRTSPSGSMSNTTTVWVSCPLVFLSVWSVMAGFP
jgi:hypothetical protein